MTVNENLDTFYGRPVLDFRSGDTVRRTDAVYRLGQDYDDELSQEGLLAEFFAQVPPRDLQALVLGAWSDAASNSPDGFLDALIERREELRALRALFVGDMTYEDCEISWIIQTDYAALLAAFPLLEVLRIRGASDLTLPVFEHPSLQELAIETGGLPDAVVAAIADSRLPALKHLELWLGDDNYGFGGELAPYLDLLAKIQPERLHTLALRNAPIADALAEHIAQQPWLAKLHTLDLSMGTLGDVGARALLASPYLAGLKRLDLRHHYIGDALVAQLKALPLELIIDAAEKEDDGERYVEVAE